MVKLSMLYDATICEQCYNTSSLVYSFGSSAGRDIGHVGEEQTESSTTSILQI